MSDLLNHINTTPREKELIRQYTTALESIAKVAEERDSLRTQLKSLESDCAVMRGLLDRSKDVINEVAAFGNCDCDIPKGHKCVPCECGELFNEISAELITHDAGKSLLERLKVAEGLLVEVGAPADERDGYRYAIQWMEEDWLKRRDSFLNPTEQRK